MIDLLLSRTLELDDILALIALGAVGALYTGGGRLWNKAGPYQYKWFERRQEKLFGEKKAGQIDTKNIAQKLDALNKDAVIFWGSQSGTAEEFAVRLARDLRRRYALESYVADFSDFHPETVALIHPEKFAIFIVSTYGEGDPCDNMVAFWNWMQGAPDGSLSQLRYMAFGLGNRNYKYYNRAVDVLTEHLHRLGASALLPPGKADDGDGTTAEDFFEWKDHLSHVLQTKLGLHETSGSYEPRVKVTEDQLLTNNDIFSGSPWDRNRDRKKTNSISPVVPLPLKAFHVLYRNRDRSCIHLEIDLSQCAGIKYKTGDHLGVWPSNPDEEVDRLLRVLDGYSKKDIAIHIASLDQDVVAAKVPTPTTRHALFRYYLDICGPVSRETVLSLVDFAPTPRAATFLRDLAQDRQSYSRYLEKNYITLGRLLERSVQRELEEENTTWVNLPLEVLIEALPALKPRYYSISSSSVTQPRVVSITMAVADTPVPAEPLDSNGSNVRDVIPGLTTNYLLELGRAAFPTEIEQTWTTPKLTYALEGPEGILESRKIFSHIRKSKFRLPALSTNPIIMVAAGTGIAPFRAFLQERARVHSMNPQTPIGRMLLFFGCRHPDEDYLYREELEALQQSLGGDSVLNILPAFSRQDQNLSGKKVYVQDRIRERGDDVCSLLMESDAHFYVCGAASMAREVSKEVTAQLESRYGWDEARLRDWMDIKKRQNRWQEDVWG